MKSDGQAANRRAPLPLHVVVIGGGFSGLVTAWAIQEAGHTVEVLEAQPEASKDYRCAYIPPNLFNALKKLGVLEEALQRSSTLSSICVNDEGTTTTYMRWHERVVEEGGQGFYRIFRHDLRDIALKLATAAGVKVTYDSKAVGVDLDGPCVMLENGNILDADLIVGADGVAGAVRSVVLEESDGEPQAPTSHYFLSGIIPTDVLKADDHFQSIITDQGYSWLTQDRAGILNPAGPQNSLFTLTCIWKTDHPPEKTDPSSRRDLLRDAFAGSNPSLLRAIELLQDIEQTVEIAREPLQEWFHETGRLVVMGDAVHPMMFPQVQDAALALEDAQVLGSFLSRLEAYDQLPNLLDAYQEVRQLRCEMIVENERIFRAGMIGANFGPPEKQGRMEEIVREMEEGFTRGATWLNGRSVFEYDACAEAEAWWQRWGAVLGGPRSAGYSSEGSLPPPSPEHSESGSDNDGDRR
ncbi:FAD/NAD(P)-binding domain-containing protein [Auricularia subglabra TFB-10046 SS5]|nr:FAD/NAD(P)-binding domain-containing protein [Auricularia subglabra TFB-10046 SS5]